MFVESIMTQRRIANLSDFRQFSRINNSAKTIHFDQWNIKDYLLLFHLPNHIKKELKIWANKLFADHNEGKVIKILSPGIGGGRNELLIIEAISIQFIKKQIECEMLDYSNTSIKELKEVLIQFGFLELSTNKYKKNNISIIIIQSDYEDWLLKKKESSYDIILAFFVINFLNDWRDSLLKTVKILKPNGILMVSEDKGDLCMLDNTFHKNDEDLEESDFYLFWKQYYKYREELGLIWNNTISPSDMSFVEKIFKEYNEIYSSDSIEFHNSTWRLSDLKYEKTDIDYKSISSYNYWLNLISSSGKDAIFDCLYIDEKDRAYILKKMAEVYQDKLIEKDLIFGQKIFCLRRSNNISTDIVTLKSMLYKESFGVSISGKKKYLNRSGDVNIGPHLLIRAYDVYNSIIHNKGNAMVSLFSKEILDSNGNYRNGWRESQTPIVFPRDYDLEKIKKFITNYGLYFTLSGYLKREHSDFRLFTELLYSDLPRKIGLLITIEDIAIEEVSAVCYGDSEIKALRIRLCKEKVHNLFNLTSNVSDNIDSSEFKHKNHFCYTEDVFSIKDIIEKDISNKDLDKILGEIKSLANNNFTSDTTKILSKYMDLDPIIQDNISVRFSYIYMILLTHYVNPNIIIYTSTNSNLKIANDSKEMEEGYYGLIIADNVPFVKNEGLIRNYYDQLLSVTFSYSGMDGIFETNKLSRFHLTKAAISAIMSRNGSHNIGSHVLSAVGHKVNDPVDMQVLIRYIQQRWDFLAQVTSVFPKWTMPVKLISQIMRGFFEQRLLINNIVLSEGLSGQEVFKTYNFRNKLQISLWYNSEIMGEVNPNGAWPIWEFKNGKETDYSKVYEKDISLSIPGGITGVHAFYTILENFIRNSAKHSYNAFADENEGLKINIEFTERGEYVEFLIYDNIFQENKDNIGLTTKKQKFLKIDDVLNDYLKDSIISQEGKLVEKNWGLAEIKIAASYLRMIDYTEIDQLKNKEVLYSYNDIKKENEKHIIRANLSSSNNLGYRFAIPKPKLFYLEGFNEKLNSEISEELMKEGIYFDSSQTLSNDFEFTIQNSYDETRSQIYAPENSLSKVQANQNTKAHHRKLLMRDLSITSGISKLKGNIYNASLKKLTRTNGKSRTYFIHIDTSGTNESLSGMSKVEIERYFYEKFGKDFFNALGLKANSFDEKKLNAFFRELCKTGTDQPGLESELLHGRQEDEAEVYREFIGEEFSDTYQLIQTAKKAIDFNYSKYEEDIETLPPYYQLSRNSQKHENEWSKVVSDFNNLEDGFEIKFVDFETAKNNAENTIVFKRHYNANNELGFLYAESLSGSQFYFNELHLQSGTVNQKFDLLFYLLETAFIDLYIVDERFEDFINKTSSATKNRLGSTNVKLIKRSSLSQNYKSNISQKISGDVKQSILIIHLGILQDIAKNTKEEKRHIIDTLKKYAQVYITSGKGNTLDIPNGEKYIPFADIQTSLMKSYPEKMILIKTLMKVVPKSDEKPK